MEGERFGEAFGASIGDNLFFSCSPFLCLGCAWVRLEFALGAIFGLGVLGVFLSVRRKVFFVLRTPAFVCLGCAWDDGKKSNDCFCASCTGFLLAWVRLGCAWECKKEFFCFVRASRVGFFCLRCAWVVLGSAKKNSKTNFRASCECV